MHYYLYEIKNNINNKIYVGVHKTKVLDDGYMGSGKVIKSAIKKHGIDNFTKIILETFDNRESMFAREKEVVTDEFLSRDDVYNLRLGGDGGYDFIHKNNLHHGFTGKTHSDDTKIAISEKLSGIPLSNTHKEQLKKNNWARKDPIKQKEHARQNAILTNSLRTADTLQSISNSVKENWKLIEDVKCPHCSTTGRGGTMKRWHFDNCKKRY